MIPSILGVELTEPINKHHEANGLVCLSPESVQYLGAEAFTSNSGEMSAIG